MGKELPKGKGLEGGDGPQATQTSGLCTLGFEQFKAAGLVQAFDLLGQTIAINDFTACPNAENRCKKGAFFGVCAVVFLPLIWCKNY